METEADKRGTSTGESYGKLVTLENRDKKIVSCDLLRVNMIICIN